jgi:ABC-type amino acid transport substrate-binding protein
VVADNLSCLQYGMPYITSGFALLSKIRTKQFDISSAVFNNDILNCATVIIVMVMSAGAIVHALERRNIHLGTLSRGVYWAMLAFVGAAENEPVRKPSRFVMIIFLLANVLAVNVLGAIMGAKLTTTALTVVKIQALGDVAGTLCVEDAYAALRSYVMRQPDRPASLVFAHPAECMRMLIDDRVDAVVTDQTTLSWYASHEAVPNANVGPILAPNSFAMVFGGGGAALRRYVDPAVMAATLTDAEWTPLMDVITGRYFGAHASLDDLGENPVNVPVLIAALVLFGMPLLMALLNGDIGPGLFRGARSGSWRARARHAIAQPTLKEGAEFMTNRDGALQGHEVSFFRFAVERLELLTADVAALRGLSDAAVALDAARGDTVTNKQQSGSVAQLPPLTAAEPLQTLRHAQAPAAEALVEHAELAAAVGAATVGPLLAELRDVAARMRALQDDVAELHAWRARGFVK